MIKFINNIMLKLAESLLPNGYYVQGKQLILDDKSMAANLDLVKDYPGELNNFNLCLYGNRYKAMRDVNRWLMIRIAMNMAEKLEQGEYAELGTYQGASAKLIYKHMPLQSTLYCFDTFEGFAEEDVKIEIAKTGLHVSTENFSDTNIQQVESFIRDGNTEKKLVMKKGMFPNTFKGMEKCLWRFVHLDCDLYNPIRNGLELFWPMMVKGAICVVHDYNSDFSGVKLAVDEFCKIEKVTLIPWIDQCGSAVLVK